MDVNLNFSPFEYAWDNQKPSEIPFLTKQKQQMKKNKPYVGLKILHNIPLSLETVCKLEPLVLSGAKVTVTRNLSITPSTEPQAAEILRATNVDIRDDHNLSEEQFDYCLDCCAEFNGVIKPKFGVVEITKSGANIYKEKAADIPVLSINDSKIKVLETFFGTGDGFIRGLLKLYSKDIYNLSFLIFGYGKVGQGVADALDQYTKDINVVDVDPKALELARQKDYGAINFSYKNAVLNSVDNSNIVVTATGIKNFISNNFNEDLSRFKSKILANIGAEDEFGDGFAEPEVLFKKQPINFCLSEPTTMRYLDPIMYAHNFGPHIINTYKLGNGYNALPAEADKEILDEWHSIHKEDISPIM